MAEPPHRLVARGYDALGSRYRDWSSGSPVRRALLRSVARWLRPGGVLLASAPLIPGDDLDPDWLGVPMYVGGVGEHATYDAVHAAGLHLDRAEIIPEDEGGDRPVRFLWITATRPTTVA